VLAPDEGRTMTRFPPKYHDLAFSATHKTILQALLAQYYLPFWMSIYIQKLLIMFWWMGNRKLLNLLSISMIAIVFTSSTLVLCEKTGQLIDAKLILGYYKHLLHLPQRFFDTMGKLPRINDAVKSDHL
jgi:ATP-binding cassette subfamily B protein